MKIISDNLYLLNNIIIILIKKILFLDKILIFIKFGKEMENTQDYM